MNRLCILSFLQGKTGVASKIAGADSVIKTVLYYFYERAWAVVAWGKVTVDETGA